MERSVRPVGEISKVLLVGFMAAGKSTVGRVLAKRLDWEFVDFDTEIEQRTGTSIPEIFEHEGAEAFRELERRVTADYVGEEWIVLAPGGGWITQPDLLERFGEETLVVWLRITPEEVVRRARRTISHRPLLASAPDPLERARTLIREREPLYRMADIAIDVDGHTVDEIVDRIVEMMT